jgi:CheY-like chemotaxis protein
MFPHHRRSPYALESATLDVSCDEEAPAPVELPAALDEAPREKRVLLLDDREDYRDVIQDFLLSCSYEVTAVSNGVEGVREVVKDAFDLIICDMMMPKLGGEMFYWATTRIRPAAGQRFIFFTGHQNDPKIQAFFERVNATVLIKPFKLEQLHLAIIDVLRKLR